MATPPVHHLECEDILELETENSVGIRVPLTRRWKTPLVGYLVELSMERHVGHGRCNMISAPLYEVIIIMIQYSFSEYPPAPAGC